MDGEAVQTTSLHPHIGPRRVSRRFATPGRLLIVIGMFFGLIFIVLTPPGFNADEPNHFFRALQIANGNLFGHPISHDEFSDMVTRPPESFGGSVPRSAGQLFEMSHVFPIDGTMGGGSRTSQIDWKAMGGIPIRSEQMTVGMSNVEIYSPVTYIPTIIAYYVGRLLNLPILAVFYLSKFLNLAVALALSWAAIKIAPRGKWIILMLSILPTTIIQFCSVSADPVTIGLCFLAFSMTLRVALQEAAVQLHQWLALMAVFVGVGLSKPVYILIAGMMVAIPLCNRRARTLKSMASWLSVIVVGGAAAFWWQHVTSSVPPSFQTIEKVHQQYMFLANNPMLGVRTLLYTYLTNFGAPRNFYTTFIGSGVWEHVFLSTLFIYALCGALSLAPLIRDRDESEWTGTRTVRCTFSIGLILLFVVAAAATGVGLYGIWTDPRLVTITGLQGRYFIPFAPLLLVALIPMRARLIEIQTRLRVLTLSISIASLMAMAWLTWKYLWRPPLPLYWS